MGEVRGTKYSIKDYFYRLLQPRLHHFTTFDFGTRSASYEPLEGLLDARYHP